MKGSPGGPEVSNIATSATRLRWGGGQEEERQTTKVKGIRCFSNIADLTIIFS